MNYKNQQIWPIHFPWIWKPKQVKFNLALVLISFIVLTIGLLKIIGPVKFYIGTFLIGISIIISVSHLFSKFFPQQQKHKQQQELNETTKIQLPHKIYFTLSKFLPIIWIKAKPKFKTYFAICLFLLVIGRILNLYVPWLNKLVVDSLTTNNNNSNNNRPQLPFQWNLIVLSVSFGFCHKIIDIIHSILWSSIEQGNNLTIQLEFFSHLHSLTHKWHVKNNKGDLFAIGEVGSNALNNVLEHLFFNILPTMLDILITIVYLSSVFNAWIGLIVIGQVILYLIATIWLMEWKKGFNRAMNAAYIKQHECAVDSLLNFETVKYFVNEDYEVQQLKSHVMNFQSAEYKVNNISKIMDLIQMLIITIGLMATSLICGFLVYNRNVTVGDYFLFFSYFGQLHGLLKYFGNYYRSLSTSVVNMETLIQILDEAPEVLVGEDESICYNNYNCIPFEKQIMTKSQKAFKGNIEFCHVTFGYDKLTKPILKDLSFVLKHGESLALVGPSGEGKSTILKLLFRLYEPWSGQILLDGVNIRQIPLKVLRKAIGIVPQDTILFNDSLRKNIMYGNVNASDEEIMNATKSAYIYDKCVSFPSQYETQVGERGLCLSGGEKLRVTIARMILKDASIYLFDEATSALDAFTEKLILEQLKVLCTGKTCITISHNLATIVNYDQIIVLANGEIVEIGNHSGLLDQNGFYTKIWHEQQQIKTPN